MDKFNFKKKIEDFEYEVIIRGFDNGCLKSLVKNHKISADNCKLHRSKFGEFMGFVLDTDLILTVDYYGYLKKSSGFYKTVEQNKDCRKVRCSLIHFASIKIEHIINITNNIDVIVNFPNLKNRILIERGFRK